MVFPVANIACNLSVNGIAFGVSELHVTSALVAAAGEPPQRRMNHSGEVELLSAAAIYRVLDGRFVEATFPDHHEHKYAAQIDGVSVLSVFDWLKLQSDTLDRARFRISQRCGIAYDYRHPQTNSYTVFTPGHWSGLLAGEGP